MTYDDYKNGNMPKYIRRVEDNENANDVYCELMRMLNPTLEEKTNKEIIENSTDYWGIREIE